MGDEGMPEMTIGGAKISFADRGEGEALLLVHGWIGSGALWNLMAPWLSERFRVIVPDLPGHADSGIPKGFPFTLDGFSDFLEDLRLSLELPSLNLVGHSMGGCIAIRYACRFPQRVGRLVLIDTPGRIKALNRQARLPFLEQLLSLMHRTWWPRIAALMIKSSVRHPDRLPPDFLEGAVVQASLLRKEALVGTTRLIRGLDLDGDIAGLEVPVMLIHGENDQSVKPTEAYRLRDAVKDARLHVVPDCGHCPNYEYPDLLVGLIEEFMGPDAR
jgi:pimeloyl-ACP methyl ester carboxylesterase